jgi:ubiquinone/menaquinone biosynthesis C-methylase UbiE
LLEYERFFASSDVGGYILRSALGSRGQWLINTPLMRLGDELRLRPEQRWLDVGCGRGALSSFVDARTHFDRPPVGLDFSAEALRIARRDNKNSSRPVAFTQGSATALPFRDGTFDVVTCGYMLKHLTDEELRAFLVELRRALSPGGVALLWDYAPSDSAALNRWNTRLLGAAVHEPHLRSTATLIRAARAAGYELVRNARLRPFLFPPMPRASIFIGKAPEGWSATH